MDDIEIKRVIVSYSQPGSNLQYFHLTPNNELIMSNSMKGALLFDPRQAENFINRFRVQLPGQFNIVAVG